MSLLVFTQVTNWTLVSFIVCFTLQGIPEFTRITVQWQEGNAPPLVGTAADSPLMPAQLVPLGLAEMLKEDETGSEKASV